MIKRHPVPDALSGTIEDTAELPPLNLAAMEAAAAQTQLHVRGRDRGQDPGDSLAGTDSWRVAPEQHQLLEHEAELGTLRTNLASMTESQDHLENSLRSLTMNLRALEERLIDKSGEIAGMERALLAREVQLGEMQHELRAQRELLASRDRELAAVVAARKGDEEAWNALHEEHESRAAALTLAQERLGGLQTSAWSDQERIQDLEARYQALESQLSQRDQQLSDAHREAESGRALHAAELLESQQQRQQLEGDLQQLRQQLEAEQQLASSRYRSLLDLQQAMGSLQGSHAELRHRIEALNAVREQLQQVSEERDALQNDLRIAEERLRAGDMELRNRDGRIGRLTTSEAEQRARADDLARQLAEREHLIHRLEHEAESSAAVLGKIQHNLARLDKEESSLPRDLVARLLVRNDGTAEIVQVLGRRTLIGRGVDCQMQIDAEFVSRRHALVLVGPDETIIEDLNSTNGIFVNGTRVSRCKLTEGDQVMVGKTLFRYLIKTVGDRGG